MEQLFDETKLTRTELLKFLVENKEKLIARKKGQVKHADGFTYITDGIKTKAAGESDILHVKAIINTTNLMDSHYDVHMPGLWEKSLKENRMIMHLQEHKMEFDKIISDGEDMKAYTKDYNWKELGFQYEGKTQALVFDSTVMRDRNPFMFGQYKKGNVKNHSVGMVYVKLLLAVNDKEYGAEFEAWEKYYSEIANKDLADEKGYFWVVKEAKIIEGSAVPLGSNIATPTISVEAGKSTFTQEPPEGTPINFTNELQTIKFF